MEAFRTIIRDRRFKVFAWLMAFVYFLAYLGMWLTFIPIIGGFFFLAALMVRYVASMPFYLIGWESLFDWHEFGASPVGLTGHFAMFAFWAIVCAVLSLPFRRRTKDGSDDPPDDPPDDQIRRP